MSAKLLSELNLEFLSLIGGYTGSSESTHCQNATLLEITCHGSYFVYHISVPSTACDQAMLMCRDRCAGRLQCYMWLF